MEGLAERRYLPWRIKLWSQVLGLRVLEVGVGTGKNISLQKPPVVSFTYLKNILPSTWEMATCSLDHMTMNYLVSLGRASLQSRVLLSMAHTGMIISELL